MAETDWQRVDWQRAVRLLAEALPPKRVVYSTHCPAVDEPDTERAEEIMLAILDQATREAECLINNALRLFEERRLGRCLTDGEVERLMRGLAALRDAEPDDTGR